MRDIVKQITDHAPGATPVQNSVSFQGLTVTALAPMVVPLIAYWFGMADSEAALVFQYIVTAAGALWGLYGILRRYDIRLPWQKPTE